MTFWKPMLDTEWLTTIATFKRKHSDIVRILSCLCSYQIRRSTISQFVLQCLLKCRQKDVATLEKTNRKKRGMLCFWNFFLQLLNHVLHVWTIRFDRFSSVCWMRPFKSMFSVAKPLTMIWSCLFCCSTSTLSFSFNSSTSTFRRWNVVQLLPVQIHFLKLGNWRLRQASAISRPCQKSTIFIIVPSQRLRSGSSQHIKSVFTMLVFSLPTVNN